VARQHARLVLVDGFDPEGSLDIVEDEAISVLPVAPPVFAYWRGEQDLEERLGPVRLMLSGSAPLSRELSEEFAAATGLEIQQGYGLTEASPNVLYLPPSRAGAHAGAVGWPYPDVEVRLVEASGPAAGQVVEGAGSGELQVRGPGVFSGYLHDPERTASAFADGWLRTGDLAERDADGCYRIVDRLKNIYISGGENVAPAEVEAVLVRHPLVADAAVVAVPDEVWGEVGVAFVEPVAGVALTEPEVLDHARQHLADFKLPRRVHVLGALPRTGIGKIARTDLRDIAHPPVARGAHQ
jgi:fatty-acyl-CoA synthase